jgi:poly(3-hydroxybutyrate) depolymerase
VLATDGATDATSDDGATGSAPCTVTAQAAICHPTSIVNVTDDAESRPVYWARPLGAAPAAGRPAVILYQGSFFGPAVSWDVSVPAGTPFGGYYQVALVGALIDAGFTVVQPSAAGGAVWETNVPGVSYDTTADAAFIPALLAAVAGGTFGAIDGSRLYATGISSGGYMTSRMAVSYPGVFRALAIESGSYATCLGPACTVPSTLPANHPPTLFLHGDLDTTVPIATAKPYYQELVAQGVAAKFDEDPTASHQWLSVAPADVTAWFTAH